MTATYDPASSDLPAHAPPRTQPQSRRSALLTGGSAGIGFAVAQMLAAEEWDLTLVARDPAKLEAAADSLREFGGEVGVFAANLADSAAATEVVKDHLRHYGGVDLLLNNAGIGLVGPIETKPRKALNLELSLNFTAAFALLQECIPSLRSSAAETGASWVVNVSSLVSRQNPPNASVYAATKSALVSLSNVAHAELSRDGVHVTALLPGFVETPGTSWAAQSLRESMIRVEDVAESVRFLLRLSAHAFVPEIILTTAGPGVFHSPLDWETASTGRADA